MNTIINNNYNYNNINKRLFTIDKRRINVYSYCIVYNELFNMNNTYLLQNNTTIQQYSISIQQYYMNKYLYTNNLLNMNKLFNSIELFNMNNNSKYVLLLNNTIQTIYCIVISMNNNNLLNINNVIEYETVMNNVLNINKLGRSVEPADSEEVTQTAGFSKFRLQKNDRKMIEKFEKYRIFLKIFYK